MPRLSPRRLAYAAFLCGRRWASLSITGRRHERDLALIFEAYDALHIYVASPAPTARRDEAGARHAMLARGGVCAMAAAPIGSTATITTERPMI